MINIDDIFNIQDIKNHDLILVNSHIFFEFMKFLPEDTLIRFSKILPLICPKDLDSQNFRLWVSSSIAALGITQKKFCEDLNLNQSRLSKFLNNEQDVEAEEKLKIQKELKRQLIAAKILNP